MGWLHFWWMSTRTPDTQLRDLVQTLNTNTQTCYRGKRTSQISYCHYILFSRVLKTKIHSSACIVERKSLFWNMGSISVAHMEAVAVPLLFLMFTQYIELQCLLFSHCYFSLLYPEFRCTWCSDYLLIKFETYTVSLHLVLLDTIWSGHNFSGSAEEILIISPFTQLFFHDCSLLSLQ